MEKLTWATYIPLAMRTASPREAERHGYCGLVTETAELMDAFKRAEIYGKGWNVANVVEELGDCLWYVAFEANRLGVNIIATAGKFEGFNGIKLACILAATYDDLPTEGKLHRLDYIVRVVLGIAASFGLHDVDFIMRVNLAKLAKRYGDKYTDQAALFRNLDEELKVLEGACAQQS